MNYKLNKNTLIIDMLNKMYSVKKLSRRSGYMKIMILRIFTDMINTRLGKFYKIAKALNLESKDLLLEG